MVSEEEGYEIIRLGIHLEVFKMNVKLAKEILSKLDDNVELIATSSNYELGGSLVSVQGLRTDKCKVEFQSFVDDFDGTHYQSKVYVPDNENGSDVVIVF